MRRRKNPSGKLMLGLAAAVVVVGAGYIAYEHSQAYDGPHKTTSLGLTFARLTFAPVFDVDASEKAGGNKQEPPLPKGAFIVTSDDEPTEPACVGLFATWYGEQRAKGVRVFTAPEFLDDGLSRALLVGKAPADWLEVVA